MSVRVRPYRRGGWEADIRILLPSGDIHRERRRLTVTSKSAATRWAEQRERELLVNGPRQDLREVPTLETFAPRFVDGHARANQQKPSGIAHKETILRLYLKPTLGSKRLDAITTEDVQRLKHHLRAQKPKSVNNVMTVLNTLLKKAVEWGVIHLPCAIKQLKTSSASVDFYTFDEYDRLAKAAHGIDTLCWVTVLLGGDAGLRAGEMRALLWTDADLDRGTLRVERNDWRGQVSTTKGNRLRYVPMTSRLREALRTHRHLRGPLVLCKAGGELLTESALKEAIFRAARKANLRCTGPAHAPAHVLFAPGDARRPAAGDSGTRGASRHRDDAAVHAPESRGDCGCDSTPRATRSWRHRGDGGSARRKRS